MKAIEVSYHRTVNLGNYNNAHLGGKFVRDDIPESEDLVEGYKLGQAMLQKAVDEFADRIIAESKLTK